MHEPYQSPLPLHSMGVEDERSSLENNGSSCGPYSILTIDGNIFVPYNFRVFQSSLRSSDIDLTLVAFHQMCRQLKQLGQGLWTSS